MPDQPSVRSEWQMECPRCHADDGLLITATTLVRLEAEGTDPTDSTHEWEDGSRCICEKCGWLGTVGDCHLPE